MKLIVNNPYRIAGILTNATLRDLEKNKSKFLKYIEVGKEPKSENDFEIFGHVYRTKETLNRAFSKLEQNPDKVNHALFWFINASPFDNTAIDYLKNGNEDKAVEIWEKVTQNKEVSSKNFSAFNNLGTFKLLSQSQDDIKEGIELKFKLIESEHFENFVHFVADETFKIDYGKQLEKLIDELLTEFKNQFSSSETMQLFSSCNGSTQKYISQKFTEEPIHQIESQIETSKKKRKENKSIAYDIGLKLFTNTKDDLVLLKSILGVTDLRYKSIADQLANEIMQCAIDYFKKWQNTKDPSEQGLKLLQYSKSIAVGSQTKERIKTNTEGIQEWAETSKIRNDISMITELLKLFETKVDSIVNANTLIIASREHLINIKNVLGTTNELYLNVSSAVVNNALQMVIQVVNEAQRGLEYNRAKLNLLPGIISDAVSAISAMGALQMNSQTRYRYTENKSTINSIHSQLTSMGRQIRSASHSTSGGCYIATMAYGYYDHPQVMELRKFRDEFLSKTTLGRSFIKFYYTYSPSLVEKLKNKQRTNLLIRKGLDHFIRTIKK